MDYEALLDLTVIWYLAIGIMLSSLWLGLKVKNYLWYRKHLKKGVLANGQERIVA